LLTNGYKIANAVTIEDTTMSISETKLSGELGTIYSEQQIIDLIGVYATKYGVDASQMLETVRCESVGFKNVQSGHILNGVREDSWGIVQINLYWNPEVTKQQALDPYFSMDFMARKFKLGKQDRWTCWRNLYLP
jgi:hypothetical protein